MTDEGVEFDNKQINFSLLLYMVCPTFHEQRHFCIQNLFCAVSDGCGPMLAVIKSYCIIGVLFVCFCPFSDTQF